MIRRNLLLLYSNALSGCTKILKNSCEVCYKMTRKDVLNNVIKVIANFRMTGEATAGKELSDQSGIAITDDTQLMFHIDLFLDRTFKVVDVLTLVYTLKFKITCFL